MSVVINRVYTRIGDGGTSRLAGGQEIDKDDPRLEAYGAIDELNAVLGLVIEALLPGSQMKDALVRVQQEMFDVGGELATLPEDQHPEQQKVTDDSVRRLEDEIDGMNTELPTLRSFVLPGGGPVSARLHHARTVARRAERRLVSLHKVANIRGELLRYMNRLSDWLFVLGRVAAKDAGEPERLWERPS